MLDVCVAPHDETDFKIRLHPVKTFQLGVAPFNHRALALYLKCSFPLLAFCMASGGAFQHLCKCSEILQNRHVAIVSHNVGCAHSAFAAQVIRLLSKREPKKFSVLAEL